MKQLAAIFGILLCIIWMSACTLETPSQSVEEVELQSVEEEELLSGSEGPQSTSAQATPNLTSNPFFAQFPDGCRMTYWCRNDLASGRPAFCTFNNCGASATAHASDFCRGHCAAGTSCAPGNITNLGRCPSS